jgi:PIN domain nuclease of toxin-antitoxin system
MKFLLDTHAIVWATTQSHRLSSRIQELVADLSNDLLVSAVSAYEIEFKRDRDGTLQRIPRDLAQILPSLGVRWLNITPEHAAEAGKLPRHHGDPFDRLLIAQAFAEQATVVTADRWFPTYGVPTIW